MKPVNSKEQAALNRAKKIIQSKLYEFFNDLVFGCSSLSILLIITIMLIFLIFGGNG